MLCVAKQALLRAVINRSQIVTDFSFWCTEPEPTIQELINIDKYCILWYS